MTAKLVIKRSKSNNEAFTTSVLVLLSVSSGIQVSLINIIPINLPGKYRVIQLDAMQVVVVIRWVSVLFVEMMGLSITPHVMLGV